MNNSTISIIDAGLGNISSVSRMIERVGGIARICSSPKDITIAEKIVLPGVGHFDYGMTSLCEHGFDKSFWNEIVQEGGSILGICLGMQLLCLRSEEATVPGLGLVDAEVKKFRFTQKQKFKVPHMGWNVVYTTRPNPLIPSNEKEQRFYFVHSYRVILNDPNLTICKANYGGDFCAAFKKGNIYGVQFHPEKSHRFGMALMKRFLEL